MEGFIIPPFGRWSTTTKIFIPSETCTDGNPHVWVDDIESTDATQSRERCIKCLISRNRKETYESY